MARFHYENKPDAQVADKPPNLESRRKKIINVLQLRWRNFILVAPFENLCIFDCKKYYKSICQLILQLYTTPRNKYGWENDWRTWPCTSGEPWATIGEYPTLIGKMANMSQFHHFGPTSSVLKPALMVHVIVACVP